MEGKYEILVGVSLTFRRYWTGFTIFNKIFPIFALLTVYE